MKKSVWISVSAERPPIGELLTVRDNIQKVEFKAISVFDVNKSNGTHFVTLFQDDKNLVVHEWLYEYEGKP